MYLFHRTSTLLPIKTLVKYYTYYIISNTLIINTTAFKISVNQSLFQANECENIFFKWIIIYSPILTILIPSSSRNLRATDTFSSFWERNVGLWLCFGNRFCASTSIRLTSRRPSDRSHSKSPMCLFTAFNRSFAHLVNVFCCIRFHSASSAKSRSNISSTSSSAEFSHLTDLSFSFILSAGPLLRSHGQG